MSSDHPTPGFSSHTHAWHAMMMKHRGTTRASRGLTDFLEEWITFTWRHVQSCLFPGFIFCMLIVSRVIDIPLLPRYDFLLIACIAMQVFMYVTKLESAREVLVITMFHLLGIALEIFKVNMGSWSYPEFGYTKVMGVPLYSGFMYASVGSYVCQAWKRFDLQLEHWPGMITAILISLGIYLNFFIHHFSYDFRWWLTALLLIVFWKTKIVFCTHDARRKMPMVLTFLLIGFFIWIAENIATYLGAWKYASQHEGWKMVSIGKISSWFLLVVLSIVIVVHLKVIQRELKGGNFYSKQNGHGNHP